MNIAIFKYSTTGSPVTCRGAGIERFFGDLTEQKDHLTPALMSTIAAKHGITFIPPKA